MLVCFIRGWKRHKPERRRTLSGMSRGDKLNAALPMMASIFECFLMLSREHVVIAMLILKSRNRILLHATTNEAFEKLSSDMLAYG